MGNYNKYKRDITIEKKVLEKYGLGGWLQENAGTIGTIGGIVGGAALAPVTGGLSMAAGASLGSTIGGGIGNMISKNYAENNKEANTVLDKTTTPLRQNPTGAVFAHGGKMKHNRPKANKGEQRKIQQQAQMQAQQQQSQQGMQQGMQQQMQQVQQVAAEELQKGVPPKQVLQELVQQGVPQQVAMQIITQLVQEMQQSQQLQGQNQQQVQPQDMLEQQPQQQMQQAYGGNLNKENGRLSDMKSYNGLYRVSDKRSPLTYNNNDIPQSQKEGVLVQYNGHAHENGGVSLDGNNEVEGNETRNGDFIFSDRIIADPKTKKTYADISKSIDKRYKNRDDKFATEAKQMELDKLKDEQEQQKQSMSETYNVEGEQYGGDEIQQHANGGSIHIKPANRGKFTASAKRAGMGTQEYAKHILANKDNYNGTLVKRANFARNFGGKHAIGGNLYPDGGYLDWIKNNAGYDEGQDASLSSTDRQSYRERYNQYLTDSGKSDPSFYANQGRQYIQPEIPLGEYSDVPVDDNRRSYNGNMNTTNPNIGNGVLPQNTNNTYIPKGIIGTNNKSNTNDLLNFLKPNTTVGLGDYGNQEPIVEEDNTTDRTAYQDNNLQNKLGMIGKKGGIGFNGKDAGLAALTNLGNLYDIYRGLRGGDKVKEHRLASPILQRLDSTRAIQQQREIGNAGNELIRQNSNSIGSYMSNIGANVGRTQRSTADVINQYANQNTGIANQEALNRQGVNQYNIQQAQQEEDLRQREKDISMNTLQHGLTGLSGGIGTTIVDKRAEDKFRGMSANEIYKLGLQQALVGGQFGTTGTNTVNNNSTIIDANSGGFKTSSISKKKFGGKLKEKKSIGKPITSNKARTSKIVDSIFNTQFIKQV